jgi:hypothetical protein
MRGIVISEPADDEFPCFDTVDSLSMLRIFGVRGHDLFSSLQRDPSFNQTVIHNPLKGAVHGKEWDLFRPPFVQT